MCGITGFIDTRKDKDGWVLERLVGIMADELIHRGPDGKGVWTDQNNGVSLGHRRLAILDLSETGHQPMISATGRYAIVFNGEIYNYPLLKDQLIAQGCKFLGTSDTEVMLTAIEEWGLEKTLKQINGMFAFAVWDKKERLLHLARDRIGEKPLYYGWAGKTFLFGSELKALKAHPCFTPEIDRDALTAYMRYNYVPVPWSIYKGIHKLPPASFLSISPDSPKKYVPEKYWNIKKIAEEGCKLSFDGSFKEAVDELDMLLSNTVQKRMVSDVPLGAFLSGGIDSSLITALMQKHSSRPIKSFCIGFEEENYNEAKEAKKIANHLGTDHVEFYVTANEARDIIPDLPDIYDEPFADPSQIPTYHVSRLAKKDVTVALSGDGGDECFAGYTRYNMAKTMANLLFKTPLSARSMLAGFSQKLPLKGRTKKLFEIISACDEDQLYKLLMSYWKNPESLVKNGHEPLVAMNDSSQKPDISHFTNRMMYWDMLTYLPEDILTKVDRASMAVSLETRSPLLDHEVIEFAWKLPLHMKTKHGENKLILRSLLERYIPKPLFDRPKQGFGVPHGQWLRGPLREWAEALIDQNRLEKEGLFYAAPIQQKWKEHLSGKHDWSYQLWGILMFQAWHEKQA